MPPRRCFPRGSSEAATHGSSPLFLRAAAPVRGCSRRISPSISAPLCLPRRPLLCARPFRAGFFGSAPPCSPPPRAVSGPVPARADASRRSFAFPLARRAPFLPCAPRAPGLCASRRGGESCKASCCALLHARPCSCAGGHVAPFFRLSPRPPRLSFPALPARRPVHRVEMEEAVKPAAARSCTPGPVPARADASRRSFAFSHARRAPFLPCAPCAPGLCASRRGGESCKASCCALLHARPCSCAGGRIALFFRLFPRTPGLCARRAHPVRPACVHRVETGEAVKPAAARSCTPGLCARRAHPGRPCRCSPPFASVRIPPCRRAPFFSIARQESERERRILYEHMFV